MAQECCNESIKEGGDMYGGKKKREKGCICETSCYPDGRCFHSGCAFF